MMTQAKNSKEMFVVNFKEIPETICVETRFITKATAQLKKDHTLFYMNVNRGSGNIELSKYEMPALPSTAASIASKQLKNLSMGKNKPPVTVSIRNKPTMVLNKPITVSSVMTNTNVQQPTPPPYGTHPGVTVTPLGLTMSAPYSTNMLPDSASISMPPPNTRLPLPLPNMTIPLPNPIAQNMSFNPPVFVKPPVEMKDSACMTEPKPQGIHREQQTEDTTTKTTISVAVQCCIDDFDEGFDVLDDLNANGISQAIEHNEEEEKEKFLLYVKENSVEYKNKFRECLLCGEVCKKSKYFYGHMAVHRGPNVLCYRCGNHLDHEALLKSHNCTSTERIARALLRCPQPKCNVTAVSRLELYDHINEHKNYRDHKCSACSKEFCTAQEFLRHLLLRAQCYTDAKRNRNLLYGLRSKADRLCRVRVFTLHAHSKRTAMVKTLLATRASKQNLCGICFRSYRNKYIFNRHILKCAALFQKQSTRKSQKKK